MLTIEEGLAPPGPVSKNRDMLDMDYINSLPQPLWDNGFPVYDICVETGLYRIDVCGLLEVKHIDKCISFKDALGNTVRIGDLYLDPEMWEGRAE